MAAAAVVGVLSPVPASAAPVAMQDVIITLRAQADPASVSTGGSRPAAHRRVLDHLRTIADQAQRPVLKELAQLRAAGQVRDIRPFWISDAVAVRASEAAVTRLRGLPQVSSVTPDVVVSEVPTSAADPPVEPGLAQIGAPSLWAQGLRGQGVVVAVLDSGADLTSPDLAASYRGGPNSWYDPYGQHTSGPVDMSGHGTWTTGIAVGGSAGGTAIGVAPDARWIAARVFNDQGVGTASAIHAALQWVVDPDHDPTTDDGADVVNNSWALGAPGCNLTFQADLQALRALDVVPVFAAGNGGPGAGSSYSPANYPEALSVGSVDQADTVAAESSRGPSTCGGRTRAFPDVTAPGKDVRTSDRYGLWTSVSGTSVAAPHAAGVLALLLSGRPTLSAAAQESALRGGALDLGQPGPDDTYGAGRLDALASWQLVASAADTAGPAVSGLEVTPNPTDLSTAPAVRGTADDSSTGGSPITSAEAFVDAPGPVGTGIALSLGMSGAVSTLVSGSVPTNLADGIHTVHVHAMDAAGWWGPYSVAQFVVDRAPPTITGGSASPSPTSGSGSITVLADVSDGAGVASATVTEPGAGSAVFPGAMSPVDGSFGGASERVSLGVDVTGWRAGQHMLRVDATDTGGRSAAPIFVMVLIGPTDLQFADGFETGSTSRWSRAVGGSRLAISPTEAPMGTVALRATISGSTPSYVQTDSPSSESTYRARFWFDPNGTRTGSSGHDVLVGLTGAGSTAFRVAYRRTSGGLLQLRAGATRKGGETWIPWATISDAAHAVEVAWTAGSSGSMSLIVDAQLRGASTGLSNSTTRLETVRLGPSAGLNGSSSGVELFDAFASTRSSVIGP